MSDPLLTTLRHEIKRAGKAQTEVAAEMAVNPKFLNQMLTGYRAMSLPMLRRLLDVLGCELILARPVYPEQPG